MMIIPALVIPLLRELETLFSKPRHTTDDLPAEFRREAHDDGICLPSNHTAVQGSPVYMPAKYH
ncbi:hypothetical protein [Chitinimonas taiwanensis]|jgi:hypothetical protein|uniref:Uncharacterized protein n=1 Tax=Chitinimonas taiwanensis DSM 18899 TaxID=1121279 RepID=A0A1K2HFK6_9NEIS|nr:hypothetical protein [Chitinimonas taiwanensis]SFZ75066.1 hypothetical protein SAMN02745887_01442 [Chitinimonas taiwanensis DSM 18899]